MKIGASTMARVPLIKSGTHFYHVTTRSNNKEWFKLPLEEVWKISVASMKKANGAHPAEVAQYVLMGNHYHMLIKTPNLDLDKFMYFFNKTFSDLLRRKSGQINRMFGGRYRWSIIDNDDYLKTVYKYICQNPIKANLVTKCENYRYSTLWYERRKIRPEFT